MSLSSPNSNPNSSPWLLNIEKNLSGNFHLLCTISWVSMNRLPASFPNVINKFSNIRISELGDEYVLQYADYDGLSHTGREFYEEKVAYLAGGGNGDDYVVLTTHFSGRRAVFRSVDQQWKIISDLDSQHHNVICFNGEFYAVDYTGRTVVVSPDSGAVVAVVAGPLSSIGDRKRFVQMTKELILVYVYDSTPLSESEDEDEEEGQGDSMWFSVFKLDRNGGKWTEVDNLYNWVLFVGDKCVFSAFASDLKCKGNYICHTDTFDTDLVLDDYEDKCQSVKLFDIKAAKVDSSDHSSYSKLFWPVPSWITITT